MAEIKPLVETFAKIKVIGVGGSGGSAVNRMIDCGIRGVEFIAVNTDVQALHANKASKKVHIGKTITRGLGAGMNPELGKRSAEEAQNEIRDILKDVDMVFITCGLGGGTGTGASPIIAEIARDLGALTVAVVTKPFAFEGAQRKNIAERGLSELADKVDAIITIPNDKLLQVIDKKTSLLDAFMIVDEVLRQGVQGISEIITIPALINVDFADVKAVMANAGSALMGIGQASGENKAIEAAKMAISSPLLEMSIEGARGILFTIVGGLNLTMNEVNEAAKVITSSADEDAKIIFGAVIDEKYKDEIKITVVATGFDGRRVGVSGDAMTAERVYTPNPYIAAEEDKEKKDLAKKKSKISPLKQAQAEPAQKKGASEEAEDELGIPAFIRKKMM
ncbi:MAG: Cell division protein FtsZ [Parcubacteria group bacterium GW2011_GWC2_42_12]|uniref:Cell division protein FtsZ n=1 Tax=Candidatus Falkowbacteria bacterium GW2011_GWA2_41_14 TaxID=1618635 RepID=A0A0G0URH2_9BACT|nr:MAG: Cell division protein FtsZ [Candidatus Falkowbacteria bacterium GW2011_GWA2_41_14]KKS35359.1 MAG: Cell division protein FtsZ [Parcubacteria group bacterium GW2011_GWC2_42_12]